MSDQTALPGELLYEYTPQVTQVVDYGVSMETLTSGEGPPPAEGARVDVYFEGPVTGAKLNGTVKGVDYLYFRADGRVELNIYGEITTADSARIALSATGVAYGPPPVLQLRENVTLFTSHPEHSWVNALHVGARDGRSRARADPGQGVRGLTGRCSPAAPLARVGRPVARKGRLTRVTELRGAVASHRQSFFVPRGIMLEEQPWKIDVKDDGQVLIISPSGEVDLSTSPELVAAFAHRTNGHRDLVCDITDVTFMDSAGVRALLELVRREPDRFALSGSSAAVEKLLDLCCVADRFRRVDR